MMKHKITSTVKDYGYYKVVQGKLSDRLGVQKKVFKYFKVNDLEELDKKLQRTMYFYTCISMKRMIESLSL